MEIKNRSDEVVEKCIISLAHYRTYEVVKYNICDSAECPCKFIEGEHYRHFEAVEIDLNLKPGETYTFRKVIHKVDKITLPTYYDYGNSYFEPKYCKVIACIESFTNRNINKTAQLLVCSVRKRGSA